MTDGVQVKIEGADDLVERLKTISDDMRYKGGRFALRKAAMIVANKAKEGALKFDDPATGRVISDNIAVRWSGKLFKRTGDLGFRVGVLTGNIKQADKGNPDSGKGGKTPHAMLLELGTEKAKAQPFLRPAANNNVSEIISEFARQYDKALDRAIKRAKKKGG